MSLQRAFPAICFPLHEKMPLQICERHLPSCSLSKAAIAKLKTDTILINTQDCDEEFPILPAVPSWSTSRP